MNVTELSELVNVNIKISNPVPFRSAMAVLEETDVATKDSEEC